MKKKIALILSLCLVVCSAAACGSSGSETTTAAETTAAETTAVEAEEETTGTEIVEDGPVLGGWTITEDDFSAVMDNEANDALEAALEGYTGMTFEPIALLGTQVVAGTNYMILCRGTAVVPDATPALKVVTVYAGVDGSNEILNVADFDLGELEESADAADAEHEDLAGGWTYAELPVANYDAEAEKAFSAAMEGLVGATYDVSAVLGTKVTNGTEYAYLCNETRADADATQCIAVVFINAGVDGTNEIIGIADLDLTKYTED